MSWPDALARDLVDERGEPPTGWPPRLGEPMPDFPGFGKVVAFGCTEGERWPLALRNGVVSLVPFDLGPMRRIAPAFVSVAVVAGWPV